MTKSHTFFKGKFWQIFITFLTKTHTFFDKIIYLMTILHNFFTISHTTIPHYKFTKRYEKFPKIPDFFYEIKYQWFVIVIFTQANGRLRTLVKYTHQIFANKRDNLEDIRLLHTNFERQKTGDIRLLRTNFILYFGRQGTHVSWVQTSRDACLMRTNFGR